MQVNEQKNAEVREEDQGKHHVHEPRGLLFYLKWFFGLQDGDKQKKKLHSLTILGYVLSLDLSMQQLNGKLYHLQRNDYSDCYVKQKPHFISQDI